MKWWVKAIIASVVVVVLWIVVGVVITEIIFRGEITEQQDVEISRSIGQMTALSVFGVWGVAFFVSKKSRKQGSE